MNGQQLKDAVLLVWPLHGWQQTWLGRPNTSAAHLYSRGLPLILKAPLPGSSSASWKRSTAAEGFCRLKASIPASMAAFDVLGLQSKQQSFPNCTWVSRLSDSLQLLVGTMGSVSAWANQEDSAHPSDCCINLSACPDSSDSVLAAMACAPAEAALGFKALPGLASALLEEAVSMSSSPIPLSLHSKFKPIED